MNKNVNFLSGKCVQAFLDFGERAFAKFAAKQIVSNAFIVREPGDDLLGRY